MGLPTGTVTLLFSDMEGSTRLLARLGATYGDLLSSQRSLLRNAFSAHHGTEMGTEGDSFFVVFASATDAISACAEGQRALARSRLLSPRALLGRLDTSLEFAR
jgi:class 3 adenylate cyclase